jgi:hypothetical protein
MLARIACAALLSVALGGTCGAATLAVSGTSDPWLAGMPADAKASLVDVGSGQAPASVGGLMLTAGTALQFSATGTTDHCDSGGRCGLAGAEGDSLEGSVRHTTGAENGIADLFAPFDSLIGVFLDDRQPDSSTAPDGLDFSSLAARDFDALSPLLRQPFFIGDGLKNDGLTGQAFIVPEGATRLYLGTMDGFEWQNNTGSLSVTVTPLRLMRTQQLALQAHEPGTLALAAASALWVCCCRRWRWPPSH